VKLTSRGQGSLHRSYRIYKIYMMILMSGLFVLSHGDGKGAKTRRSKELLCAFAVKFLKKLRSCRSSLLQKRSHRPRQRGMGLCPLGTCLIRRRVEQRHWSLTHDVGSGDNAITGAQGKDLVSLLVV